MEYAIVVHSNGTPIAVHGPFKTKAKAELWAETSINPQASRSIVPIYNPGKFR